jgi:peptide/nickel transport system permease protein
MSLQSPSVAAPPRTRGSRLWQRAAGISRRSPTLVVGGVILAVFLILALCHRWIMPFDPLYAIPNATLLPPGAEHWFGTDNNGMDVLSRVIFGSIYAFGIAIPVIIISLIVGVPVGLMTGYAGGFLDEIVMRLVDGLRVFPSIILVMAMVAAAGPSLLNIVIVMGILDAPVFVRLVRAEVLALRSNNYVEAAIAVGNPTWRILLIHLLPNAMNGAIAQTAVRAAWAVRISATLAFLGIGIQPPAAEWGAMIRQGAEYMVTGQWWIGVFPGLALILMVFGLNTVSDGLQELLDPRRASRGG